MRLKHLAKLSATLIWLIFLAGIAQAQSYPTRPVKFLVPYPPGGGNDILARVLAERLGDRTGQRFYVENVSGASGNIGTSMAAKADPDGYTILMANNTLVINPALYKNLAFDVQKDFLPIAMVSSIPMLVVVHPSLAAKSIGELAEIAKKDPDGLAYATPGMGTPQHLATELFADKLGLKLRHVPYRGTGPAVSDTIGGHVKLMFGTAASVEEHVKNGSLRVLAITSAERSSSFPDIPTVAELGLPGYDASLWYGILVPSQTPIAVAERLSSEIAAIVNVPKVAAHLKSLGYETKLMGSEDFGRTIRDDLKKWQSVVQSLNLRAE
jgi:tripartite-type tricarboxylate transporter receptor subunit TctC